MKYRIFTALLIAVGASSLQGCKFTKAKEDSPETVQVDTSLSESPRHHEWRTTVRADGTELETFLVYPEVNTGVPAVIVIHENRGLNDWARSFADQLGEAGYLVAAPDLISNTVEGVKRTTDFANSDEARKAIYGLEPNGVTADLNAVYELLKSDPACNGSISVVGFCWGGSQSFRYAVNNPQLKNAFVFYGTAPAEAEAFTSINCSVYGFYGENDQRVNATIEATEQFMLQAGKTYEPVIYPGATHAFMRKGDQQQNGVERDARDAAWDRLLKLLSS